MSFKPCCLFSRIMSEDFVQFSQRMERLPPYLFGTINALKDSKRQSGIDIIAQPPGKRLQSIQLLSGGEKALTAMALMFAIFK